MKKETFCTRNSRAIVFQSALVFLLIATATAGCSKGNRTETWKGPAPKQPLASSRGRRAREEVEEISGKMSPPCEIRLEVVDKPRVGDQLVVTVDVRTMQDMKVKVTVSGDSEVKVAGAQDVLLPCSPRDWSSTKFKLVPKRRGRWLVKFTCTPATRAMGRWRFTRKLWIDTLAGSVEDGESAAGHGAVTLKVQPRASDGRAVKGSTEEVR